MLSSTSLFFFEPVFWSTFFEEELYGISQPSPWVELHHWITFLFFSAFCLLCCQGSSQFQPFLGVFQSWHFSMASVIVFIFPVRQGSLINTKEFCLILKWRFEPWCTWTLLCHWLASPAVGRMVISPTRVCVCVCLVWRERVILRNWLTELWSRYVPSPQGRPADSRPREEPVRRPESRGRQSRGGIPSPLEPLPVFPWNLHLIDWMRPHAQYRRQSLYSTPTDLIVNLT